MSEPRKIHLADQIGVDLRLVAQMLASYKDELIARGFTEEERLALLLNAATVLLPGPGILDQTKGCE